MITFTIPIKACFSIQTRPSQIENNVFLIKKKTVLTRFLLVFFPYSTTNHFIITDIKGINISFFRVLGHLTEKLHTI